MLLALVRAYFGVYPQQWTPGRLWQSLPQEQLPSFALQGPWQGLLLMPAQHGCCPRHVHLAHQSPGQRRQPAAQCIRCGRASSRAFSERQRIHPSRLPSRRGSAAPQACAPGCGHVQRRLGRARAQPAQGCPGPYGSGNPCSPDPSAPWAPPDWQPPGC